MKNICVYCGSRIPTDATLFSLPEKLGAEIASRGWTLVYGGGKVGTMGLLADATLEKNGQVTGVIPTHLKNFEVAHPELSKLYETQDMHTRKALMESLSEAFIVLPGGFGTLDEFFEILTWKQLGIHNKPIMLLNAEGYYNGLLEYFDMAISKDFIRKTSMNLFTIATTLEECMEMLENELRFE